MSRRRSRVLAIPLTALPSPLHHVAATRPLHPCSVRRPALYIEGRSTARPDIVSSFRLPCPPPLAEGGVGALAAERRVRKAYFATLDALRTGVVEPDRLTKLARLLGEVRSATTRAGLEHLRLVQRFVWRAAAGWPVIVGPEAPLDQVVVTAPFDPARCPDGAELEQRYAWALDWLRTHRWLAGREVAIEWRPLAFAGGEER